MSLETLVSRYIVSAERVFDELKASEACANAESHSVRKVLESAKAYLEDAKYYRDKGKLEVSLTSVAYCEGLLDALRMLGMVKFEWPAKKKKEK
jgi:FAD synthetase